MRRFVSLFDLGCPEAIELPEAVEIAVRESADGKRYVFLLNYTDQPQTIRVQDGKQYVDLLAESVLSGETVMKPYEVLILEAQGD